MPKLAWLRIKLLIVFSEVALTIEITPAGYIHRASRSLNPHPEEIDASANLLLETSRVLGDWFNLSPYEIFAYLPSIDTSRTDIWHVCPAIFKPVPCTVSRFRSMTGKCNNMKHTIWGSANTPFVRLIPPVYTNGIDSPRVSSVDGGPLPNARRVSAAIHKDYDMPERNITVLFMSWGQFIDHDLTLAAQPRDENEIEIACCKVPPALRHKYCMPLQIPANDPFYSKYDVTCMDFKRTMAGHLPGCALGPRVHINLQTASIDANFLYGSADELATKLRLGTKGLMRTWDKFGDLGLKELCPPLTDTPEKDCIARPRSLYCFLAGDERVNEQIHLTVLHTLYVRHHNRIARILSKLNRHWEDERLYQETRHIIAAQVQYIAYNEFLPILLGPVYRQRYNLTLQQTGDHPNAIIEFSNAKGMYRWTVHPEILVDAAMALTTEITPAGYIHRASRSLNPHPEEIDASANLLLETSRVLGDWFNLSPYEIFAYLPSIDTSRTDIWHVCPAIFKPVPCTVSRFRSMTGKCNNMKHTIWGSANTPFVRLIPPVYTNGIDSPRVSSVDGGPLPNARRVSAAIHKDYDMPSSDITVLFMSWGQFIDHDLTLAAQPRDENEIEIACCKVPPALRHKYCMPLQIPANDPFYSKYDVTCMDFKRTMAGHLPGCALGPRVHINLQTASIDANFLYGSTDELATKLRLGTKGLMRTWDKFGDLGLKELLPPLTDTPEKDCIARPRSLYCFLAGDERVNEQIHLTVLHTLYVRHHNRIARILSKLNRHWEDERLYQETRHIIAAQVQYIAYNEFLPILLGPVYRQRYNLTLQQTGHWYGYDENAHMGISNAFQSAAFRFGHTFIQSRVRLYDKYHQFVDSIELRQLLRHPFVVNEPGIIDHLVGGLINTPAQTYDPFISSEVTNHLFQEKHLPFGIDLVATNLLRGREMGVPGYNHFREWCGLGRVETFAELEYYMSNGTAFKFSQLYKHPDDIDLWSAGVSEKAMSGALVGPTFACIIAHQFRMLRKGDRFWHENPGLPSSFTPAQLREIRKTIQSKIICENADDVPTIQIWGMRMPNPITNPRLRCEDLPDIDFSYWEEDIISGEWRYTL
ncbi:LOW QUALITY PROTEIN: chorion peroxidase-like [Uloborus diversus]|uniref:LOW QUALITY PROTEIN: chorion peroxidase-like n=1 Tax=Uloborus diversus TaxID=327109 RepID=UPI0024095C59|nr:LOW QUALITY PROTEIN: chorion peroxidase-like [Uloborus diversus]